MEAVLGISTYLIDQYNEKVSDLGLGQFFVVDKGWDDDEVAF